MINPYEAPKSNLDSDDENNSGQGQVEKLPDGVAGWSWGAFLLNWIWAIGNNTWIGLIAFLPYVGFIMSIVLGMKGRQWAWQNKRWDSVEHFQRVQKRWSVWGVLLTVIVIGAILASIAIPEYHDYVTRASGS
jgi:hypothetical protein